MLILPRPRRILDQLTFGDIGGCGCGCPPCAIPSTGIHATIKIGTASAVANLGYSATPPFGGKWWFGSTTVPGTGIHYAGIAYRASDGIWEFVYWFCSGGQADCWTWYCPYDPAGGDFLVTASNSCNTPTTINTETLMGPPISVNCSPLNLVFTATTGPPIRQVTFTL